VICSRIGYKSSADLYSCPVQAHFFPTDEQSSIYEISISSPMIYRPKCVFFHAMCDYVKSDRPMEILHPDVAPNEMSMAAVGEGGV
jgi:hypothetical protein